MGSKLSFPVFWSTHLTFTLCPTNDYIIFIVFIMWLWNKQELPVELFKHRHSRDRSHPTEVILLSKVSLFGVTKLRCTPPPVNCLDFVKSILMLVLVYASIERHVQEYITFGGRLWELPDIFFYSMILRKQNPLWFCIKNKQGTCSIKFSISFLIFY